MADRPYLTGVSTGTDGILNGITASLVNPDWDNTFKTIIGAGWANQSDGDVDAPTGYFSRISIEDNELAELVAACDLGTDDLPSLEPGHYVTLETTVGIIMVFQVRDEASAQVVYGRMVDHYTKWLES